MKTTLLGTATLLWLLTSPLAAQPTCGGKERWPVKVGSDPAAKSGEIDVANPIPISVSELVRIERPSLPHDDQTRTTEEKRVYTVSGRLVKFKREAGKTGDQDFHLVVSDDTLDFTQGGARSTVSPHSVIAEIVRPKCISGRDGDPATTSAFGVQIETVFDKFEQRFPNITGGWNDADGIPVTITGVAFFDRDHGQVGRALNGLELHPVLDISFGDESGSPTVALVPEAGATDILNPGFEEGRQGWTGSPGVIGTDEREPARTGAWKAWIGGHGEPRTETLCQQLTLPMAPNNPSVRFYLHVSTEEETGSEKFDTLRFEARNAQNRVLKTLTTYSNLQAQPGFQIKKFNLSAFRGQTIRLCFVGTEDRGSLTSFILDDFRLILR